MESLLPILERDDDEELPFPLAVVQPCLREPLEDAEIGPSSSNLPPGCNFHFKANDLDAAIRSAKKMKMAKKTIKTRGKKKKKTVRRKLEEMDQRVFVLRTSRYLKEPKRYLIKAAVERLGIHVVHDLVLEVKTIDKNGGQTILNGKRQQTPGGVLWNVLSSRYEEDYKAIMTAGKAYEMQRRQQKRKRQEKHMVEENEMIIDGQPQQHIQERWWSSSA